MGYSWTSKISKIQDTHRLQKYGILMDFKNMGYSWTSKIQDTHSKIWDFKNTGYS